MEKQSGDKTHDTANAARRHSHPAAFAKILNKEKRGKDQYFFSTGTIQPLVSGILPHCIPVMVSYSF